MNKMAWQVSSSLYWPICRAYSKRFIKDKPSDSIYRFMCSIQFYLINGFWPDFLSPRRFSEKLWGRMLHDRNPQMTLFNDKLRVRDFVVKKIGFDYLVPKIWSGDKPEQIPFNTLPEKYVIKANHGCGLNIIVQDRSCFKKGEVLRTLNRWVATNFCEDRFLGVAWGYRNIKPAIIIEEFLEQDGKAPADYKFWCFEGRMECVTVHFDRFTEHSIRAFGRNLEPSAFSFGSFLPPHTGNWAPPKNYHRMVEVVEELAEGSGFMRVDLYCLGEKIYFGELTPYPGGGYVRFRPPVLDRELGAKWKSA
jgi:hypothetical protein